MHTIVRLAVVSLLTATGAVAQNPASSSNPPPAISPADRAWQDVKVAVMPPPGIAGAAPGMPASAEERNARRRQMGEQFRAAAERAKAFYQTYPDHPRAAEARQLEAKSLLNVAMSGDNSQEGYAATLISEIRRDQRLTAKARLEAVALAEIVRIRAFAPDRKKFLAAHEESARSLIMEFPGEPGAYEGLLRQAESHPEDAEGARIARDVLKMPAPQSVKDAAQFFLDRQALMGKSVSEIFSSALGETNPVGAVNGQGLIIYAWTTQSPGSIAQAKNLQKLVPAGVSFIGVNLDADVESAKAMAAREGLPGTSVYDPRGREAPLVRALKFSSAFHVYVADRQGVIRQISAERGDLTGKLGNAQR